MMARWRSWNSFHSPVKPGRRRLPVNSCCIRAFFCWLLFASRASVVLMALSHVERTAAIFSCTGRGGSKTGIFSKVAFVIFTMERLLPDADFFKYCRALYDFNKNSIKFLFTEFFTLNLIIKSGYIQFSISPRNMAARPTLSGVFALLTMKSPYLSIYGDKEKSLSIFFIAEIERPSSVRHPKDKIYIPEGCSTGLAEKPFLIEPSIVSLKKPSLHPSGSISILAFACAAQAVRAAFIIFLQASGGRARSPLPCPPVYVIQQPRASSAASRAASSASCAASASASRAAQCCRYSANCSRTWRWASLLRRVP